MLDLTTTPFSRRGSYVAISRLPAMAERPAGIYLRSLRGPLVGHNLWQPIFHIQLVRDGEPVPFQESASPTALHLQSDGGQATVNTAALALTIAVLVHRRQPPTSMAP